MIRVPAEAVRSIKTVAGDRVRAHDRYARSDAGIIGRDAIDDDAITLDDLNHRCDRKWKSEDIHQ